MQIRVPNPTKPGYYIDIPANKSGGSRNATKGQNWFGQKGSGTADRSSIQDKIRPWVGPIAGLPVIGPGAAAIIGGAVTYADIKEGSKKNTPMPNQSPGPQPGSGYVSPPSNSRPRYTGPSADDLARYSDAQVRSEYRPTLNELTRQIEAANAMGMQSQATIGGWGKEAGREIRRAGRRNYREVQGIQNNMGNMLGSLEAVVGPMYTKEGRRSAMQSAAGTAGLIAGLGAADQGWFNRARDVNAQTTNFYRNNARDQYAQQAADLLAQRNDAVAAMRDKRTAGRIQAQQQAYENQVASQGEGSDGSLGLAMQKFQESLGMGGGVKQLRDTFANQISSPEERRYFNQWVRQNYFGTANTAAGKARLRLVEINRARANKEE